MTPPPTQAPAKIMKPHHPSSPRPDSKASKKQAPTPPPSIHYTLLIRLPFERGSFEDPPQVEWDASKDKKLWKIISKNPKSGDIDWAQRADEFGVTQPFLLQQAAWLYERHFQHVKAQMSRLRSSNAPTPVPGATAGQHPAVGGYPMKRLGSGGSSRAPSSLSIRPRDSPIPRVDTSIPGSPRPVAPPLSRTPSTNTVTQSRHFLPPPSPRQTQPIQRSFRTSQPPPPRKLETAPLPVTTETPTSPSSLASSSSSSSTSDSDNGPIRRSQMFRRPPPFQQHKKSHPSNVDDEGEDSEDDSPTFLPFAKPAGQREDPSATLRDTQIEAARVRGNSGAAAGTRTTRENPKHDKVHDSAEPSSKKQGKQPIPPSKLESSASSASSAPTPSDVAPGQHKRLDALSPRHRAELARLSPRNRGKKGDGSDGTPSMGSSFSDLDDTSITQSALEEALASNLRHGGASRLSTISHAFRSRYL